VPVPSPNLLIAATARTTQRIRFRKRPFHTWSSEATSFAALIVSRWILPVMAVPSG
jgi:hypothetical protein